jgi:hypothetical protein
MATASSTEIVRYTPFNRVTRESLGELGINPDQGTGYELKGKNVLNKYRSLTYVFTLAALPGSYLENPNAYRQGELGLVILRSGGKGTKGIFSDVNVSVGELGSNTDQGLSNQFNSRSPGRFDMFMDNVEIETYMAYQDGSNATQPTKIKFDITEPYSVNGFIEALAVTSIEAGYTSYMGSNFLLKIEFWGWPDDQDVADSKPEKVPNSERYFPFVFNNIEVDITERGTRYRCEGVPTNERAFAQPSKLKKAVKMTGITVKEILENLMKNITDQNTKIDENSKVDATGNKHDRYFVKFPSVTSAGFDYSRENEISGKKLVEIYKNNVLYDMVDPATTNPPNAYKTSKSPGPKENSKRPESFKYEPNKTAIQFPENMNVHDIIAAVITDSEYTRNILKSLTGETTYRDVVDENGMVNYFLIKIETKNRENINPDTKKYYQDITYVITPFKIHKTRIPLYGSTQRFPESELTPLAVREYNYIYTGKNVDVLDFRLQFNSLFFEALPTALGNKETHSAQLAAQPDQAAQIKSKGLTPQEQKADEVPPTSAQRSPVGVHVGQNPNAGQNLNDPFGVLARNMHEAIINAKASMIQGEIKLLGDPIYLVTGGIGNFRPELSGAGSGVTTDQEAAFNFGDVMIAINFRNPIDIGNLEQNGSYYFNDKERVPFSGIYRVITVVNSFQEGKFIQRLNIIRVPGQILGDSRRGNTPPDATQTKPAKEDQPVGIFGTEFSPQGRAFGQSIADTTGRGLPSFGNPGQLSNFTGAPGGLGGNYSELLSRTPGFDSGFPSSLSAGAGYIGGPLPTLGYSDLRFDPAGITRDSLEVLSPEATLGAAADLVSNGETRLSNALSIAGSIDSETSFTKEKLSIVSALGNDASELIGNVGRKINEFVSSVADPQSLSARSGVDVSRFSGLSNNLTSKFNSQISQLGKATPGNLNLDIAQASGRIVDFAKISSSPPSQPYSVAPTPILENNLISRNFSNQINSGYINPVDQTVRNNRLQSADSLLSNITNIPNIRDRNIAGAVSSQYQSKTSSTNPLDKLMRRG